MSDNTTTNNQYELRAFNEVDSEELIEKIELLLQHVSNFLGIGLEYEYEIETYETDSGTAEILKLSLYSEGNEPLLIGYHGRSLGKIQALMQSGLQNQLQADIKLSLDIGNYRAEREESLRNMAMRAAKDVIESGQELSLAPMKASERLVVHKTLSGSEQVKTESRGEGRDRHIVIVPAE